MAETPERLDTAAGVATDVSCVPLPSCPDWSSPQHSTVPADMTAQVLWKPAARPVTLPVSATTPEVEHGSELHVPVTVALPRALYWSSPQQTTPLPSVAHACW